MLNLQTKHCVVGYTVLLAGCLLLVFSMPHTPAPGIACEAFSDTLICLENPADLPAEVAAAAATAAVQLFPEDSAKADTVRDQMAATYLAARDMDVVIYFNPGGWGWDPLSEIPGWEGILEGIGQTLKSAGLNVLTLDYKRTAHGLSGPISEIEAMMGAYPVKVDELTALAGFLTDNLPDLKIILCGESQGAAVCEQVIQRMRENQRVFSIQTGPAFWHPSQPFERSLVIDHNGTSSDTFSHGDWLAILRANLEAAFGIYTGSSGNILLYIGAPGHDYSWEFESVRGQITQFLSDNFISPVN